MGYEAPSVKIYSNDGSTLLYDSRDYSDSGGVTIDPTVTKKGMRFDRGNTRLDYIYTGSLKFLGFATSPNATEPTYIIGDRSINNGTLYIIESLEGTTWYVDAGWEAEAGYGEFAIHCRVISDAIDMQANPLGFNIGYSKSHTSSANTVQVYNSFEESSAGIDNSNGLTIDIYHDLVGTPTHDSTNPKLIAWLTKYGIPLKVKDLTDTTWYIPKGWEAEAGYGKYNILGFTGMVTATTALVPLDKFSNRTFGIGYQYVRSETREDDSTISFSISSTVLGDYLNYYTTDEFRVHITGGTDVKNPKLIAWLSKYGAQLKVTDLTNTAWYLPVGWKVEAKYGRFDDIAYYVSDIIGDDQDALFLGYTGVFEDNESDSFVNPIADCLTTWPVGGRYTSDMACMFYFMYGVDLIDYRLINWISMYGVLQEESPVVLPPDKCEIYYKDSPATTLFEGETIVLHTKDVKFLGDIVIKNVGVDLISFTIDAVTHYAIGGMSWNQWVASEYNVNDYAVIGGFIQTPGGAMVTTRGYSYVIPSAEIYSGEVYITE